MSRKTCFHRGAQSEQHEFLIQTLRVLEYLDQGRDSGTIDVPDGLQVQSQLRRLRQGVEKGAAEDRRSPQIHISFHFHYLGIPRIANRDLHVVFLSSLVATNRFPSGDSS